MRETNCTKGVIAILNVDSGVVGVVHGVQANLRALPRNDLGRDCFDDVPPLVGSASAIPDLSLLVIIT